MNRRRISASFSIRKRLPIRIFGSTIYETICIPLNPVTALLIMAGGYLLGKSEPKPGKHNLIDTDGGQGDE